MIRFVFVFIFLGLFGLILYINGASLLKLLLCFFKFNKKTYWIIFWVIQILLIGANLIPNKYIQLVGNYYLGFIIYYFMFNLVILFISLLPCKVFSEGLFIKIIGSLKIILTTILIIYGGINANRIQITEYRITSDNIDRDMNIVMFSDLHLGGQIGLQKTQELVEKINDLDADIVLIAGDTFNGSIASAIDIEDVKRELMSIESTYGVYAVLGNHDLYQDAGALREFFADCNIVLLEDTIAELEYVSIIGRKDLSPIDNWNQERDTVANLISNTGGDKFTIMMDHQANGQNDAISNNVDLVVSGHTHNGQIFPGNLIVAAINKLGYGHELYGNTNLVVSSGVGYWGPPIRVGSKSEIVNIRITSVK